MRWLWVLMLAGCTQLPDVPEIDKASIYVSIVSPGVVSRVILACPAPSPPLVPARTRK